MNYHVRRQDQDLGAFSLAELRRRRDSGEMTGSESVRAEGTTDWQSLETLLQRGSLGALPPPLPRSASAGSGGRAAWILVGAGVILLAGLILFYAKYAPKPPVQAAGHEIAAASRPVLLAQTPTSSDFRRRTREFNLRQWLEGYEKRGKRNPSSDAEVDQFIRASFDGDFEEAKPAGAMSLGAESLSLEKNPNCTDPLALAVAAINTVNWYDRVHLYERSLAAFPGTEHRAYPILYANVGLMRESKRKYDSEGELNKAALKLLSQCFADGSFVPADQQDIAEILYAGWGKEFFELNDSAICDIVHQAGPSYKWLSLVMDGDRYVVEAWKARGGGYSNTVTDEGRQGFNENLASARKNLIEAWTLEPTYPLAPSMMIYVSMGDSGLEEMRTWFDRTLAAQIDYPGAWVNMRWGLRPRWYGSQAAMLALGKTALSTGRFDTDVPRKLFDCVSDLESELGTPAGQHIYGRDDIWPELQKMYEGYIAEPTQASRRNGWRTSYAVLCRQIRRESKAAGGAELEAAARLHAQLGRRPFLDAPRGRGPHRSARG
jgi:hypothetical protein